MGRHHGLEQTLSANNDLSFRCPRPLKFSVNLEPKINELVNILQLHIIL